MLFTPHLFRSKSIEDRRQEMLIKKRQAKHRETCRIKRLKRQRKA